MIMGIDEAGRGSIFGPLIIGMALFDNDDLEELVDKGLKDSKLMTPKNRDKLYHEIIKRGKIDRIILTASEIDRAINDSNDNLNKIEIRSMAKLIIKHKPDKVYIDAVSSPENFKKELEISFKILGFKDFYFVENDQKKNNASLEQYFQKKKTKTPINRRLKKVGIIAENKADINYPVVSAASVVAKVERDLTLREIEKKFDLSKNSLGKGYPNNDTKKFLENNKISILENKKKWNFIRYTWKWAPLQQILRNK